MNRGLVIGRTNVGKTLFCIHFARYLGVRELVWEVERTDGKTMQQRMSLHDAEQQLSSPVPHRTRELQTMVVRVPRGKDLRALMVTDSTGLTDGIHPDADIREAMAQTLSHMLDSRLILHMVDAADIGRRSTQRSDANVFDSLDEQLHTYGESADGYLIIANKMDLPEAKQGYKRLCQQFSKQKVIPISALKGMGFREVKQHVWRFA